MPSSYRGEIPIMKWAKPVFQADNSVTVTSGLGAAVLPTRCSFMYSMTSVAIASPVLQTQFTYPREATRRAFLTEPQLDPVAGGLDKSSRETGETLGVTSSMTSEGQPSLGHPMRYMSVTRSRALATPVFPMELPTEAAVDGSGSAERLKARQ